MLSTGFAYLADAIVDNVAVFGRVLPQVRSIRRPGAAALDLSYVAAGRLDGFWELTLSPWDVAAGVLIVQEAGGIVTGGQGEEYRIESPVLVATNGPLHRPLLELLQLES
jgi:myo-inositol-1(or 4)-monophosphatase